LCFFKEPIAGDALAFAILPFILAGLSLVHFWSRGSVMSMVC
jgi:hypothetical protein